MLNLFQHAMCPNSEAVFRHDGPLNKSGVTKEYQAWPESASSAARGAWGQHWPRRSRQRATCCPEASTRGMTLPRWRRRDVLVDFWHLPRWRATSDAAIAARVPIVVGTTGLEERHHFLCDNAAESIAVLQTGNTSLGVTLLAHLVREAASLASARTGISRSPRPTTA